MFAMNCLTHSLQESFDSHFCAVKQLPKSEPQLWGDPACNCRS